MDLIRPDAVKEIDAYATSVLHRTEESLIREAGASVAREVLSRYNGGKVLILCGGGNNGADGYATALSLADADVPVMAFDVFGKGQRSEGGRAVLAEYVARFGMPGSLDEVALHADAAMLLDAVLGAGARLPLTDEAKRVAAVIRAQQGKKVAIDLPLGVDGDLGEVSADAVHVDATVMLSLPKRGLYSYPAREYTGELILCPLGLDTPEVRARYSAATLTDENTLRAALPARGENTHKGSFGKLVVFSGSARYRGAPALVTEAAARMGVGLVHLVSEAAVTALAWRSLPELLLSDASPIDAWEDDTLAQMLSRCEGAQAVLVGPGSGVSEGLYRFVTALLSREGCPLLLDADALGALALHREEARAALRTAKRQVLMTPHPLELARLLGVTAAQLQQKRMRFALDFAKDTGVFLLLKGAATVITDGERLFINGSGSSALAKGGSGDVLSGAVGALLAQGTEPLEALACAAYLHGRAGDELAKELSAYGVTPSDLPRQMARELAKLLKENEDGRF